MVPNLKRVSSGSKSHTKDRKSILESTGHFDQCSYHEASYTEHMTAARYLQVWESVNDIRSQAGEDGFRKILAMIEEKIAGMTHVDVPYLNRAWSARRTG